MKGKISLKDPDNIFWVMERHIDPYVHAKNPELNTLLDIFFGIEIARSKSCARVS